MPAFNGQVVVVTGAGRGLGREHALLLAREGARVVVNDLGSDPDGTGETSSVADEVVAEIRRKGGAAVPSYGNVAEPDGAEGIIQTALREFGDLHVLVNNAGVLRDRALVTMTDEDWNTVVDVNLLGTMLTTRAAARHWRAQRKGGQDVEAAVVNTSSESGLFANAGQGNYAAAKSAVASLTQVCAKELARYGVRANAVVPRARTRLTEAAFGGSAMPRGDQFDRWHPGNVSPLVVFLASPRCTLTGEVILAGGSLVQRVRGWELDGDWKLKVDGRWSVDALATAVEEAGPPEVLRDTGLIR